MFSILINMAHIDSGFDFRKAAHENTEWDFACQFSSPWWKVYQNHRTGTPWDLQKKKLLNTFQ